MSTRFIVRFGFVLLLFGGAWLVLRPGTGLLRNKSTSMKKVTVIRPGVMQFPDRYHYIVDAAKYLTGAKEIIGTNKEADVSEIVKVAVLLIVHRNFNGIDWREFKGKDVEFSLQVLDDGNPKQVALVGISGEELQNVKGLLTEEKMNSISQDGPSAASDLADHFQFKSLAGDMSVMINLRGKE